MWFISDKLSNESIETDELVIFDSETSLIHKSQHIELYNNI